MAKKKDPRAKGKQYVAMFVETKRGRVQLPEWIHVREDLYREIIDLLECVKTHCAGPDTWLAEEARKLLKECPSYD